MAHASGEWMPSALRVVVVAARAWGALAAAVTAACVAPLTSAAAGPAAVVLGPAAGVLATLTRSRRG